MEAINQNQLFAKTNPVKLFFKAAVPGAIGMAASNIYYVSEALMVGRFLGELPFAAMNLATPLVLINYAIADLIGVGSSVHLAIKLGEGKEEEANRMFTTALILILLCTSLFSFVLIVFAPWFFKIMGADPEVSKLATDYLRVYALLTPICGYAFAFDNYLRICGKIRQSMYLNLFMAGISALIEFTLLYFLRLPLPFAALGTSLGMIIAVAIVIVPFARGKMALKIKKPDFGKNTVKDIFTAGTPVFLSNMAGRIFSLVMNYLLIAMGGTNAISIYGIVMNTEGVVLPFLYGMCDSLQPAVGYNLGQGNTKRVKALEKCCFIGSAVISIAFGILMLVFNRGVVTIFMGSGMDDVFMASAKIAVALFALNYLIRWISYATQSFASAIGESNKASMLSLLFAVVFPSISIVLLWPLGVNGLYLNTSLTALLAAVVSLFVLRKMLKKLNKTIIVDSTLS